MPFEGPALLLREESGLLQELVIDPRLADVAEQGAVMDVAAFDFAQAHAPADHVGDRGDRSRLPGMVNVEVFEERDEDVRGVGEEVERLLVLLRVVDGHGGLAGESAEHFLLLRGERATLAPRHHEHPQDAPVPQRRAHVAR